MFKTGYALNTKSLSPGAEVAYKNNAQVRYTVQGTLAPGFRRPKLTYVLRAHAPLPERFPYPWPPELRRTLSQLRTDWQLVEPSQPIPPHPEAATRAVAR